MLVITKVFAGELHPTKYYWGQHIVGNEDALRIQAQRWIEMYGASVQMNRTNNLMTVSSPVKLDEDCLFIFWVEENEFGLVMP